MEAWRKVWRNGFAPLMSLKGLEALYKGLSNDDIKLIQGATTSPPPLIRLQDWPVESACLVGYCGWLGDGLKTVKEVEEFFALFCFECDKKLQEPAGCRWFLNWFDETPRDEMRKQLLPEVSAEIQKRKMKNEFN